MRRSSSRRSAKMPEGRNWTYLSSEPFDALEAYRTWLAKMAKQKSRLDLRR